MPKRRYSSYSRGRRHLYAYVPSIISRMRYYRKYRWIPEHPRAQAKREREAELEAIKHEKESIELEKRSIEEARNALMRDIAAAQKKRVAEEDMYDEETKAVRIAKKRIAEQAADRAFAWKLQRANDAVTGSIV